MEYLAHHGVKGQKWGVRRYQNPDGSLTPEGKERYHKEIHRQAIQQKVFTGAINAYGGAVIGGMAAGSFASLGLLPISAVVGSAVAGAGAGVVAASRTYWKDISFNEDMAHVKIESGKYFMQHRVKIS